MNDVMKTILHRRSIRSYRSEQIPKDILDEILKAALYAPSAGGRQSPMLAVCQNREINEELGRINMQRLSAIAESRPAETPGGKKPALPGMENGKMPQSAFRGAPTVITFFAPKDWYNFTLDCAVSAENMMLAADSFGIGSCMIARAAETFGTERGKDIQKEWNIPFEYEAKLHVMLGYPEGKIPEAKPRKEGHVIFINE